MQKQYFSKCLSGQEMDKGTCEKWIDTDVIKSILTPITIKKNNVQTNEPVQGGATIEWKDDELVMSNVQREDAGNYYEKEVDFSIKDYYHEFTK